MPKSGKLRIIGGQWRSRILRFPQARDLRPTPDRIRETLFNWLRNDIPNSRCLDLFAGSGALGFEAASRGADTVWMVEKHRHIVQSLLHNANALEATRVNITQSDAIEFIEQCETQFDIIFVDPPYRRNEVSEISRTISQSSLLNSDTKIYIESPTSIDQNTLPSGWCIVKEKRCGQVHSTLIET